MEYVISVENLKKTYPASRKTKDVLHAVNGISFNVKKDEIFGILGPNGAGKTTTMEIIEGLKKQTSGNVTVLEFSNLKQPDEIKKRIGVQLQSSEYLPSLTLSELITLFGSLYGRTVNPMKLLAFVGLEEKAGAEVKNLSGGQKQRFTIASSLVNEPQILFLDEPTTGLDPKARRNIWELIRHINSRGITVVMTTHYMEEAEYLCNRVAIMDRGAILEIDEPKKLINDLSHTTQISFFVTEEMPKDIWQPVRESIEKLYSNYPKVILEIKTLDVVGTILTILKEHHVDFSGFTVKTASLEDVYLHLTGKEYESE